MDPAYNAALVDSMGLSVGKFKIEPPPTDPIGLQLPNGAHLGPDRQTFENASSTEPFTYDYHKVRWTYDPNTGVVSLRCGGRHDSE